MDARNLLEVNEPCLTGLAVPPDCVLVLAATWGRGCDPGLLSALEPHRRLSGYNGTVIAVVPLEVARNLLGDRLPQPEPNSGYPVVALAYGKAYSEWRGVI
ncbi:MAG: hypothetical protein AB1758_33105 [Candidatus Eremiobacterota bacterium]